MEDLQRMIITTLLIGIIYIIEHMSYPPNLSPEYLYSQESRF